MSYIVYIHDTQVLLAANSKVCQAVYGQWDVFLANCNQILCQHISVNIMFVR